MVSIFFQLFLSFSVRYFVIETYLEASSSQFGCFVSPFIQDELEYPLPNDLPLYYFDSFASQIARFLLIIANFSYFLSIDALHVKHLSIIYVKESQLGKLNLMFTFKLSFLLLDGSVLYATIKIAFQSLKIN